MTGGSPGRAAILWPVALAAFITALDNTVVNVALPSIQRDLGLSVTGLEWVATSYILAFSSLLLAGGRLADLFGRRRVLLVGLAVFAAGSLASGLSTSGGMLIAARVGQGAGGAAVLPATLAILATDLAERDRQLGAGVLTAAIAAALALGPAVGGTISQYLHWNWVFYLNLPVCVVTAGLAYRSVGPGEPVADPRPRLDGAGLVTSGLALFALTYALVEGNNRGWTAPVIVLGFVAAGLAGTAFVAVESRRADPLVDVSLFRSPVFSGGTAAQVLWGLGVNGVFFFTSLFLQGVLGFSPTGAGLVFVPLAAVLIACVPVTGYLVTWWGLRVTVTVGLGMVAWGLYLTAHVGTGAGLSRLLPGLMIIGAGSAFTTPLTASVLGVVPAGGAGMASAVLSTAREVSGVLGVAVTGAILLGRQHALARLGADPATAFVGGYARGLKVSALLVGLGAVISFATLRPAARHRGSVWRRPPVTPDDSEVWPVPPYSADDVRMSRRPAAGSTTSGIGARRASPDSFTAPFHWPAAPPE